MIEELQCVALEVPVPEHGLQPDNVGVVVLVHPDHAAYEVEFTTLTGKTLAVLTLNPDQIRSVGHREVAHASPIGGIPA